MKPVASMLLKTVLPLVIGVGVVMWMMGSEFSIEQFRKIPFTTHTLIAILLAWLFMAGREWGMMWRWRVVTDRFLSWGQTFQVTMMCEFTSAVTPTTAGGSALSMVFLHREGMSLGRGAAISMITLMLDELFIVIMCPLLLLLVGSDRIFGFDTGGFESGVKVVFWIVYAGVCAITLFLFMGSLVWPHKIASGLSRVFALRWLRRWKDKVDELGRNLVDAGTDLRSRPFRWWAEAMTATAFTWISRYLVVNALFWGFAPSASQTVVFARQFVVWTLLTVSPTPGGSGVSEWLFTNYYGDLLRDTSMALVIAVIWRIITYYIYLIIGAVSMPSWLRTRKKEAPSAEG